MRAFCIPIGRLQRFSIMKIKKDQSYVYDNKYTVKSDVNKRLQWVGNLRLWLVFMAQQSATYSPNMDRLLRDKCVAALKHSHKISIRINATCT